MDGNIEGGTAANLLLFGGETGVSGVEIVVRGFPRRERDRKVLSAAEEEVMSSRSEREVMLLEERSMVSSLSL